MANTFTYRSKNSYNRPAINFVDHCWTTVYRGYFINIQSYFKNGRSKPEGSNNHPSNLRVIAEMDAR